MTEGLWRRLARAFSDWKLASESGMSLTGVAFPWETSVC